jgi:hypothetical protein
MDSVYVCECFFVCVWVCKLLVRGRSNGVGGSTASSAVVCARMYVCMYVEARAYAIATLWQILKRNRYRTVGNFVQAPPLPSRDTDVLYRRLDARNVREGCVKIWKQSV